MSTPFLQDVFMIHPYGKKARKTKRPLPESGKLLKYRRFFSRQMILNLL
jgi:hypothetical protein